MTYLDNRNFLLLHSQHASVSKCATVQCIRIRVFRAKAGGLSCSCHDKFIIPSSNIRPSIADIGNPLATRQCAQGQQCMCS